MEKNYDVACKRFTFSGTLHLTFQHFIKVKPVLSNPIKEVKLVVSQVDAKCRLKVMQKAHFGISIN